MSARHHPHLNLCPSCYLRKRRPQGHKSARNPRVAGFPDSHSQISRSVLDVLVSRGHTVRRACTRVRQNGVPMQEGRYARPQAERQNEDEDKQKTERNKLGHNAIFLGFSRPPRIQRSLGPHPWLFDTNLAAVLGLAPWLFLVFLDSSWVVTLCTTQSHCIRTSQPDGALRSLQSFPQPAQSTYLHVPKTNTKAQRSRKIPQGSWENKKTKLLRGIGSFGTHLGDQGT